MAPIFGGEGQVSQGIIANSCGEWQFKEGKTKTVSLSSGKLPKKLEAAAASVKGKKASIEKAADKASSKVAAAVDALQAGDKKGTGKTSRTDKNSLSKTPKTPQGGKRTK